MIKVDFSSPREAAKAFTPELTALIEQPLYGVIWEDKALSKRDRSLITVAALVAMYRPEPRAAWAKAS